jgi:hypothetical protein
MTGLSDPSPQQYPIPSHRPAEGDEPQLGRRRFADLHSLSVVLIAPSMLAYPVRRQKEFFLLI